MAANTGITEGQDFLLYVEVSAGTWTAVAHATTHTLEEPVEMRDRNTKDSGKWKKKKPGLLDWKVTCEALVSYDGYGYNDLKALKDARSRIQVKLAGRAAVDDNDNWVTEQVSDKYQQGYGYIASLSQNLPNNEDGTMSISIEGDGALTTNTVAA